MKKILIVFLLIVILSFSVSAAKQSTQRPASSYDIAVTLINQEPDPAEPGKYVDVRFKVDNNGTEEAQNVEIEVLPEYPFSFDAGRDASRRIGTLQSRQKGDVGVIEKFRLRIDKDAVEGENELRIRYRVDNGVWIEPEEFIVNVRTHDAILSVDSVEMDKDSLEPGANSNVRIKLSNKADSILKDIKVNLDVGSVPIIPLGSSNEKSVYQINPKGSYEFSFELLVEPEAASGAYKVPMKVTYADNLGNVYIKNGTIGLIIGAAPDISVTLDKTEVYEHNKAGEITIKVVNKGVTDLKFVNILLKEKENLKVISSNEVYLGNIDSDDFETASFNIFVGKSKKENVLLPLRLEYKDANNNNFSESIGLQLKLYSALEAKRLGLVKGNGLVGVFIVIIISAAGLFFYINYRKKKKKA